MSAPAEVLDTAGRFVRSFSLPLDAVADWALVEELMGVHRRLRRDMGAEGALDAMARHLGDDLAERGFSLSDLRDVAKSAANGKLHGRVLFAHQAKVEAEHSPIGEPSVTEAEAASTSVLVRLDTVKAEKVSWLWPGRIPYGKLTVIDGDPGKGKSALSVDLAARMTAGHSMPGETAGQEPAGVVLLTAEDGLADTVRPRLQAAGGDASRVVALDGVRLPSGACRMPTLADVENIRDAIKAVQARLVIIDPIMAYLGTKDGHKDQDVRSIAHPVAHLAEETGAAVVLIRHLTKSEKASPIYRGGGSIGIAGAARSVLLVASDRDDPELRVLASVKSNLSAPPPSLSYRLVPEGDVVRVAWEGPVDVTAAALLAAQGSDEEAGGRGGAEAFLRELLAEGPCSSKEVFHQAREAGISEITLKRAKASLGIKAHKLGGRFGGDPGWCWEMPASPEGDHSPLKGITDLHDPLQAQVIPFRGDREPGEDDL
jgi:hypothetical protein